MSYIKRFLLGLLLALFVIATVSSPELYQAANVALEAENEFLLRIPLPDVAVAVIWFILFMASIAIFIGLFILMLSLFVFGVGLMLNKCDL